MAYVRWSDVTLYDLLNMMNQGTSILPVAPHLRPSHFEATDVRRAELDIDAVQLVADARSCGF